MVCRRCIGGISFGPASCVHDDTDYFIYYCFCSNARIHTAGTDKIFEYENDKNQCRKPCRAQSPGIDTYKQPEVGRTGDRERNGMDSTFHEG